MMKAFCSVVFFFAFTGFANADYIPVRESANKNGFVGCNGAIDKELKDFEETKNGRYIDSFFKENPDIYTVVATWGKVGDNVTFDYKFSKKKNTCFVDVLAIVTDDKPCIQFKEDNPALRYVTTSAGVVFTQNAGGVNVLLKDFKGGCLGMYQRAMDYPADQRPK